MDPTNLSPAGDENADHASADEVTKQPDVSPPQVRENDEEKNQCDILTEKEKPEETIKNDEEKMVEANNEEMPLEKEEDNGSSSNDKKSPEELLNEIQMQNTHNLYCPKCTHNITQGSKLFPTGHDTFPYNEKRLVLGFVVVFSFKSPFIYIPWFHNNTPEPLKPEAPPVPPETNEDSDHGGEPDTDSKETGTTKDDVVTPVSQINTPTDDHSPVQNNKELTPTENVNKTSKKHVPDWLRFVLFVVLLFLLAIVLWFPPHDNGKIPDDPTPIYDGPKPDVTEPIPPSPPSYPYIPSNRVLSVIPLLLLAILVLCWPSISRNKRTKPEIDDTNEHDKTKVPGDKEVVDPQNNGPSTPVKKPNDSGTISKLKGILWRTELDIVKSIVYGGLIESITSLGVVSSAAAFGTSTLNVLALGLANLFSGLFLIIFNFYGLVMSEPFYQSGNIDHMTAQKEGQIDPYKELLGNKDYYILHCVVVVISFLFFGMIPPLFYGFSFKITDKGLYEEAAVVVAASLVCVISLSSAKAYAFGMDQLKTVAVYTGIAIGACTLSFIASQHARDMFEKYDVHKLASDYLKE